MKIGEIYSFEDKPYFAGKVMVTDVAISLLESEIKRIRASFEILKAKERK